MKETCITKKKRKIFNKEFANLWLIEKTRGYLKEKTTKLWESYSKLLKAFKKFRKNKVLEKSIILFHLWILTFG